ncbi:MAG: hypothetical protein AAF410_00950 [Pseudomonadota bacterium]
MIDKACRAIVLLFMAPGFLFAASIINNRTFIEMCNASKDKNLLSLECIVNITCIYESYIAFNDWDLIADTLIIAKEPESLMMAKTAAARLIQTDHYKDNAANQMVFNALADACPCE